MTAGAQIYLAVVMGLYVLGMLAISIRAQKEIHSTEDYLVAGRRLPLSLAWATILATWFGAGTVLIQADEVREAGLQRAAIDPFGAGLSLILTGLFFASRLWKMQLLTVSDFFARQYGRKSELLSALIMVPSYFGWIAAQLVALAGVLHITLGIPPGFGIALVAVISVTYTLMGGMWSVTLTDAIQIGLVILGLILLTVVTLLQIGGLGGLVAQTDSSLLSPVPTGSLSELHLWLGVLLIGILGNVPGQDLMQRVFSAKSATVARSACLIAGALYLLCGMMPLFLGLASRIILPEVNDRVVTAMGMALLHPVPLSVFLLALLSAILSTIDSAILSPASVLSQNVFSYLPTGGFSSLALNRIAVLMVAAASTILAYVGASAYELLESAYELTMAGLFVPFALGAYLRPKGEWPGLLSMLTGIALWLGHFIADQELFLNQWPHRAVAATGIASLVYLVSYRLSRPNDSNGTTVVPESPGL